jgi:hypothetical protein
MWSGILLESVSKLTALARLSGYELDNRALVNESASYHQTLKCRTKQKQTPWPLVRKRTIPTARPPLVSEI